MNDVYVDPAKVSKAASDVQEVADFCGTEHVHGDMEKPGQNRSELDDQLMFFQLGDTLKTVDSVWAKKCRRLGGEFETYRDNLVYYANQLGGQDHLNAQGLDDSFKPQDWVDKVPDSDENDKGK